MDYEIVNAFGNEQYSVNESANSTCEGATLYHFKNPFPSLKKKIFLIVPGGGYARVAIDHEGLAIGRKLVSLGYESYVLQYRLPNDEGMDDKRLGPMQDLLASIEYVRKASVKNNEKLVLLGFSAGGHLVSSTVNLSEDIFMKGDFNVLVYPVISMNDAITHKGSKKHLLGIDVSHEDVLCFSAQLHVDATTPPTFLVHSQDDKAVYIENSMLYKEALDNFKIPNHFFVYERGGHGFGLVNPLSDKSWFHEMLKFVEKD